MATDKWDIYHALSRIELTIRDEMPPESEDANADYNRGKVAHLMCNAMSRLQEAQGVIMENYDPCLDTP